MSKLSMLRFLLGRKQVDEESRMDQADFRAVLRRECALYSSNLRSRFILLVFDRKPTQTSGDSSVEEWLSSIFRRMKMDCYYGILSEQETGLLLPDGLSPESDSFINSVLREVRTQTPDELQSIIVAPRDKSQAVEWSGQDEPLDELTNQTLCGNDIGKYIAIPMPQWKRMADITVSLLALFILSPVMITTAVLIKMVSPAGSVLFQQERIGLLGRPFICWKFRTMTSGSDQSAHREHFRSLIYSRDKMTKLDRHADPRVIPFGTFLRKAAIDELPQLFNVLKGEMSLIGPRPSIPYEYDEFDSWQRRRTEVAQGMTGLWQVSGKNETSFPEMIRLDIFYADNLSPSLDLQILLKTPEVVIRQALSCSMRQVITGRLQRAKWTL